MQHKNVNPHLVKVLVKKQFLMNKDVTDQKQLDKLKNAAMSGLTNYVMHLSQKCDTFPLPTRGLVCRQCPNFACTSSPCLFLYSCKLCR